MAIPTYQGIAIFPKPTGFDGQYFSSVQKITSRFFSVLPIEDTIEVNRLARYRNDKPGS